ncbi:hypothetical protein DAPPUDRAFT_106006 [Daphnia pulex]|uniref:Dynactin subunit 5 n=1 Tax=Daphnia pulex TaxID=6669 RepID=E9GSH0_DAPPU|nr:hypothetical protein DAPPUDRAFT_106006 [Daphnia pulex]|eukprot:EFX77578.1 hypothetical protein DAPPUDRAFT_106006 [Daphnia pulex]
MELEDIFFFYDRQSTLCGSQNIILNGKNIIMGESMIRGDLANVRMGQYCILSKQSVIRPPFKKFAKGVAFFPLHVGDHVFIGENSVVNAAVVGSYVYIGKNCVIVNCCMIADDTVLPPETVVSPFTVYSGSPGHCIEELPEAMQDLMIDYTNYTSFYQHYIPDKDASGVNPLSIASRK